MRGVGCRIVQEIFDEQKWQKIMERSKQMKLPVEQAVFDSDFFKQLNMPNYSAWSDFNKDLDVSGLLNDPNSFIEIKAQNRKKLKVFFKDIFDESLLFPLYNIELVEAVMEPKQENRIIIAETEIGLIASYDLFTPKFEIQKLKLFIAKITIGQRYFTILSNIFYDEKLLMSNNSDTLVTGNFCYR